MCFKKLFNICNSKMQMSPKVLEKIVDLYFSVIELKNFNWWDRCLFIDRSPKTVFSPEVIFLKIAFFLWKFFHVPDNTVSLCIHSLRVVIVYIKNMYVCMHQILLFSLVTAACYEADVWNSSHFGLILMEFTEQLF